MKNKTLAKRVATIIGAGALVGIDANADGELRIDNLQPSMIGGKVRLVENGSYAGLTTPFPTDIYHIDGQGEHSKSPVNTSFDQSFFDCPLIYNESLADGTSNFLRFRFMTSNSIISPTNNFPSNLLITSKNDVGNYHNAFDVIKSLRESSTNFFDLSLPNIYGAVAGHRYGTNTVLFTRKDSSVPNIENLVLNGDGTAYLEISGALPAGSYTPQYSTNMVDWESCTNKTTYVPVNVQNFGTNTSVTISNVPASGTKGFYRIKAE